MDVPQDVDVYITVCTLLNQYITKRNIPVSVEDWKQCHDVARPIPPAEIRAFEPLLLFNAYFLNFIFLFFFLLFFYSYCTAFSPPPVTQSFGRLICCSNALPAPTRKPGIQGSH